MIVVIMSVILLMLCAASDTVREVIYLWGNREAYAYAWLIIPTTLALMLSNRIDFLSGQIQRKVNPYGFGLIGISVVAYSISINMEISIGSQLSLLFAIFGVIVCNVDNQGFRKFIPYFMLLVFTIPMGDVFIPLLKIIPIYFVSSIAYLTGNYVMIEGYQFNIGNHSYLMIDACSGMDKTMVGMVMGIVFSIILRKNIKVLLSWMCIGGLLAILMNIIRVSIIVVIDSTTPREMPSSMHIPYDYISIAVVLIPLFAYTCIKIKKLDNQGQA